MADNILRPDPGVNDERLYPAGYVAPVGPITLNSLNGILKTSISEVNDVLIGGISKINGVA